MKPKSTRQFLALVSSITAFASASLHAVTYQWNGSAIGNDSNWATDSNWTGTAPNDTNATGSHRLNVNGTAALIHTADQGTTVFANASDRGIVIGSGSSGTMNITGGSFSSLGSKSQDIIGNGDSSTGVLNISAGAYIGTAAGTSMGLGGGPGRVSTLTLSGSGIATVSSLQINTATANINLNGGTLETSSIVNTYIESAAKIRFNGGTLKARQSTTTFISSASLLQTLVQVGGAVIDSNTFDITIAEPLLEDATSPGGGLTKNSAGLLTLSATSTVKGPVDVTAGGLGVKSSASSWSPSSFTHSGDTLNFNLGTYNSSNPAAINTGAFTVDSAITVNVTGTSLKVGQIPLIQYVSKDFTGGSLSLNTGSLPANIVATLVDDDAGLIYLDVTQAPTTYVWSGDSPTPGTGNWDTASLNWNNFADAYSTAGTQIIQFPDIVGGGTVSIAGDYSPLSISINNLSGNPYSFAGIGKITNSSTLTKSGTGIAYFNGAAHDFSGATTISSGAIIKQAADGTTGAITVSNNATFALDGGITTGTGQTIILNGPGATGANYFYTGSAVQRGALQAQNGANAWNGNVVVTSTANTRIGVQDGASLTIGGNITESIAGVAPTLRAGNFGDNITLNGVCSWTGDTFMYSTGGSIILGGNDRLPIDNRIVFTGSATVFDLNGHNQQLRGLTSYNPTVTNEGATPSILTLSPPAATSIGFYGVIIDGAETISVVKSGEGTIILGGNNTYSGPTTVNSGTLLIDGNQVSATGAVLVNGGTLGGTATIGGDVTIAPGGKIAPGTDGTIETLDVASNTAIAGIFACDVNAATTDRIVITGDLTLTGSTLAINPVSLGTPGSYVIATYTGNRIGTLGGTLPAGYSVTYDDTNKEIELIIAGAGYAQWATENNAMLGENGDDDQDGISNLVEYALGLDPQLGNSAPGTLAGNLLTFNKGTDAKTAGDLTYSIETSTTLGDGAWTTAIATEDADSISYLLPTNEPGGKLFARLKVSK